jgi:U3 small nucleolar RNA-associated protein 10
MLNSTTACRINEFHVEAILMSAMPYHSTNEFVRLVQCLTLDNASGWTWLSRMQEHGAAMPRQVLVERSTNDKVSM